MSETPKINPPVKRRPGESVVDPDVWRAHQDAMGLRLDRIAELERQIGALQAAQIEETAAFVADRVNFDQAHGFLADQVQYRGMVAEVALAKRVSVITAGTFMDDAWRLATAHPKTMTALKTGALGLYAARMIALESCVLDDPAAKALADQVISEDAVDVLPGKVRGLAERRVSEIDPDAAERRTQRERADKHVQLQPAGSGMAWLNAYLPAEHAQAAWTSVRDHAKRLRAAGDPRSTSHLICDTLVERLTGASTDALPSQINVVMTDATLLGLSDDPAQLVGVGPLAASLARQLATNDNAWLRRFLTDPVDGSLTHGDVKRRKADGSLRALVVARDQHCRGIQCASPISDLDHVLEHAKGGLTTLDNLQGVSKNCHTSRDDPRMHVRSDTETGVITWTTPTGRVHRTLPPPAIVGGDRRQRLLRGLLVHPPDSRFEVRLMRHTVSHLRTQHRRC